MSGIPRTSNLDWLHIYLDDKVRWRCINATRPRQWQLDLPFLMIPRGSFVARRTAMGVIITEEETENPILRRIRTKSSFRMAREALHIDINESAMTGKTIDSMSGKEIEFDYILPVELEGKIAQNREEFEDRYELIQGSSGDRWVLKDKKTDALISFVVPEGLPDKERHDIVTQAMIRMEALNRRLVKSKIHATLPS